MKTLLIGHSFYSRMDQTLQSRRWLLGPYGVELLCRPGATLDFVPPNDRLPAGPFDKVIMNLLDNEIYSKHQERRSNNTEILSKLEVTVSRLQSHYPEAEIFVDLVHMRDWSPEWLAMARLLNREVVGLAAVRGFRYISSELTVPPYGNFSFFKQAFDWSLVCPDRVHLSGRGECLLLRSLLLTLSGS